MRISRHSIRTLQFSLALRRGLLMFALAAALLMSGLSHRLPQAMAPDLAAYVLAGGSLADLCGMHDDDHGAMGDGCPFCRLVDMAAVPPAPASVQMAMPRDVSQPLVWPEGRVEAHPVRGPPLGGRAPPYV